jgi:hypothetical protein
MRVRVFGRGTPENVLAPVVISNQGMFRPVRSAMRLMLAPSKPRSAKSAIAAFRMAARVTSARCCCARVLRCRWPLRTDLAAPWGLRSILCNNRSSPK